VSFHLVYRNVIGTFASSIHIIAVMKWKQRIICSLVIFWYVYKLVYCGKFEVITRVNMKITVFMNVSFHGSQLAPHQDTHKTALLILHNNLMVNRLFNEIDTFSYIRRS
jgi:hypothetical protein